MSLEYLALEDYMLHALHQAPMVDLNVCLYLGP